LIAKTERQKDFCVAEPLATEGVDTYELMAAAQTFEPDKPFIRNPRLRRPPENHFAQNSISI
jgi:hypothetical protein